MPATTLAESSAVITGDVFHHIIKVLRLKQGDEVLLFDGEGTERIGVIDAIGPYTVTISLYPPRTVAVPSYPAFTLYQGLPKGDKIDLILQKATELGAAAVVVYSAERSVKKVKRERSAEVIDRWRKIVREAARQSGRNLIPEIIFAESLAEALRSTNHDVKLLLWEEEQTARVKPALESMPKPKSVGVIIGPEGGITNREAAEARIHGYSSISLGPRVLRTETAGLAILTILQYWWGDLGE